MSLPKDELNGNAKKNNEYYNITEEDLRNGEITVHVLSDGRHLYALRYGKQKDNMALIALATIEGKYDNKQIRDSLLNKMNLLKMSPKFRDINNVRALEDQYRKTGFELTPEAEDIFSHGSKKYVLNSVVKTVEYNDENSELEHVYYDTIKAEKHRNAEKLKQYLKKLSKLKPTEYQRYKNGQETLFKVMTINSLGVPKNYEEAKYVEDTLNAIERFDRKSVIRNMKLNLDDKNNEKNDLYRGFLELKLSYLMGQAQEALSEAKEQGKTDEIQKIREYVLFNHGINEYLLSDGKRPTSDKEEKYLQFLENLEIIDNDELYQKEIAILLQAVDPMKTELYRENQEDIKAYCEIMKQFGVVYELEPMETQKEVEQKSKEDSKRPEGGFEPGD